MGGGRANSRISASVSPGTFLFIGLTVANGSNYVFQVLMSRMLGPADYSLLGSIFAFLNVMGISCSALQAGSAKAVAASGRRRAAAVAIDPLMSATLRWGLVPTVALAAISPAIGAFLHSGTSSAFALSLFLVPAALLAIGQGRLQGLEAFVRLALLSVGLAGVRIILGPLALVLGLGITGVVLSTVMATAAAAWWAIAYSRTAGPVLPAEVRGDLGRASVALVLFWVMVSLDVIVARHSLPAPVAGQYAAAAVLGKAVLWLPSAFALIMFPRVTRLRELGEAPHPPLVRALGLATPLCVIAVAGLWLLGPSLIPLFFGPGYRDAAALAWKVGACCIPFVIANLFAFYHLTRGRSHFLAAFGGGITVEIAGFGLVHPSTGAILAVLGGSGTVLLLGLTIPGGIRRLRLAGVVHSW